MVQQYVAACTGRILWQGSIPCSASQGKGLSTMRFNVCIMETEDMLDWMLAEAKKRPMKISHDFDTRFRVWMEQIIPARVNAIRICGGDHDYAVRMVRLTEADAERLISRRRWEYEQVNDKRTIGSVSDVDKVFVALMKANDAYLNEVKE